MSFKAADVGIVPEAWDVEELRYFLDLITYGFTNPMPDSDEGPWKLTAKDVVNGRINYGTARRTTIEAFKSKLTDKSRPRVGDVLLTKDGSIGRVAVVDRDGVCINQSVALLRPKKNINPEFLKYLLISPHYQRVMEGDSDGSTIKHIYITRVDKMQVAVPPLAEQSEILKVVGTIDDRITLLRETNATLEAIAQALFKSWFVDFDPVHAKAEGRARQDGERSGQPRMPQASDLPRPGAEAGAEAQGQPEYMDAATAALFPDSFEESELGLVPKGWSIGQLQDLLVLQRGFDLPAAERIEGEYPLIAASGPSGTHHTAMAKGPGVITGRSGVLGKVFLTLEDYWPLNTTLWVKEFKRAKPCFAFQLLKLLDFASFNAGSAVPTLNRNHVHSLKYVLPPVELVGVYEDTALVIYERVLENNRQAQTLTQLRDTLLPRLISGQLRLPEAEATVEEVL